MASVFEERLTYAAELIGLKISKKKIERLATVVNLLEDVDSHDALRFSEQMKRVHMTDEMAEHAKRRADALGPMW